MLAGMNPRKSALAEPMPVHPGRWRSWMAALRPASLPLAASPVLVGTAAAFWQTGTVHPALAAMALLAAVLMQAITNLQNDVGYTARSGERLGDRVGLPRATAEGWLTPKAVRRAILALSLLAFALGMGLVTLRGWPVLVMGLVSLLAALAYMGGPRPIAYTPLGELTVFVFFGLVAVPGTEWLLAGATSSAGWLGAVSVGAVAAAVLAVNNLRDASHDRLAGRRTLAVVAGPRAMRALIGALLAVPMLACAGTAAGMRQPGWLLPLVLLPRGVLLWRALQSAGTGPQLTAVVLALFRLTFWVAAWLSAAMVLARVGG